MEEFMILFGIHFPGIVPSGGGGEGRGRPVPARRDGRVDEAARPGSIQMDDRRVQARGEGNPKQIGEPEDGGEPVGPRQAATPMNT
jgi:hypothetical protein